MALRARVPHAGLEAVDLLFSRGAFFFYYYFFPQVLAIPSEFWKQIAQNCLFPARSWLEEDARHFWKQMGHKAVAGPALLRAGQDAPALGAPVSKGRRVVLTRPPLIPGQVSLRRTRERSTSSFKSEGAKL